VCGIHTVLHVPHAPKTKGHSNDDGKGHQAGWLDGWLADWDLP